MRGMSTGRRRRRVTSTQVTSHASATAGMDCKTVGFAYPGSNPGPATTCENGLLAGDSRLCGPFLLCPVVCHPCRVLDRHIAVSTGA